MIKKSEKPKFNVCEPSARRSQILDFQTFFNHISNLIQAPMSKQGIGKTKARMSHHQERPDPI